MHLRDVGRQGAIHVNGHLRQLPLGHPLADIVNHDLGAAETKSGNEDFAAARDGRLDDLLELVSQVFDALVGASAVGAFADNQIGGGHGGRLSQKLQVGPTEVARESDF